VIRPQVQMTAESHRPANATLNPFVDIPRTYKRPLTSVEGEALERGSVQRPWKRNYKGLCTDSRLFPRYLKISPVGGEQGKPAPGYRCKRCDGTDVCSFISQGLFMTLLCQHFINNCPERARPPQEYICKICNNVRE
jgi:hypothetical protein